jgi:hypothetical protein
VAFAAWGVYLARSARGEPPLERREPASLSQGVDLIVSTCRSVSADT